MHVVLGILRIAGIVLLVLLGILVLALAVLLFVPLRYRGWISTGGDIAADKDPAKISARLEVTWLFKLISFTFLFQEKAVYLRLRAAWKTLLQRGEEPREEESSQSEEESSQSEEAPAQEERAAESAVPAAEGEEPAVPAAESAAPAAESAAPAAESEVPAAKSAEPSPARSPEPDRASGSSWFYGGGEEMTSGERHKQAAAKEKDTLKEKTKPKEKEKPDASKKPGKKIALDGLAARLYQQLSDRIFEWIGKADGKMDALGRKMDEISLKARRYAPLADWVSRGYYGWLLRRALGMLRHFRVRNARGHLLFGTGRPDLTGMLGGVLTAALPWDELGDAGGDGPALDDGDEKEKFVLLTDFYRMSLDTNASFSGRVRLCHAAALALRVAVNRDTWMMLRKVRGKDPYGKKRGGRKKKAAQPQKAA